MCFTLYIEIFAVFAAVSVMNEIAEHWSECETSWSVCCNL